MMNKLRQEAERLLSIPCAGYEINTSDGYDFDCGYDAEIACDDCVCNFLRGYTLQAFDPLSNKPISKKVLKYMYKISREEMQ